MSILETLVFWFKILSLVFSFLFFLAIIIVESKFVHLKSLMAGKWEKSKAEPDLPTKSALQKRWESALHKVYLEEEADFKAAISEADSIMEEVFKKLGYPNIDIALSAGKITVDQVSNIEELREAHKKKVKILSDPNSRVEQAEASRTVAVYGTALKELQVID